MLPLLRLVPEFRSRVWGGQSLKPSQPPTGEAWIVHEDNVVDGGPLDGKKLKEIAATHGANLLGSTPWQKTGERFPLLIKLLDCADWLSIQVHPDDALAAELVGPGAFGKTEAWYFLEATEDAQVISGVTPGTTAEELASAIRAGNIRDYSAFTTVTAGDAILMPARTMHALGPGLVLYEVQQTSDTTYRVWDWDRPATDGRQLHIEESVRVTNPDGVAPFYVGIPWEYGAHRILESEYFQLDRYDCSETPLVLNTLGESFYLVTAIDGAVAVITSKAQATLGRYETLLVPANTGEFRVNSSGHAQALVAHVPTTGITR